ncbi:carboxymuconolactone decarboxylase family protein [Pseudoruegeria sp. HB172150]|uniref:carboxymuconolactone decarboxylase family protein n=1 Tax=Pseudoruegeria sp. HB172150 TaxID=2721164 RepID=UPI001554269C|nr:carboxymuconolactone decarboxylase family protein [Pseudoruegeria sp. HB172150]
MPHRLDYAALSPELFKKYYAFTNALLDSVIPARMRELVAVRVSQMNGCAHCVDLHVRRGRQKGESEIRMHHLAVWRESPLFDEKERAALEWTEALTHLGTHGVPDTVYDAVRAVLTDKEVADLTFVVMGINGWNRASVAFQAIPGESDKVAGLEDITLD